MQTSEKKPQGRRSHSTCLISGDHPSLMVIGGYGRSADVFSDAWLLDVTDASWSEVLHIHAHVKKHGVY